MMSRQGIKRFLILTAALLWVLILPAAAFAASQTPGYTVDSVAYTADLQKDGSALVTESWTVSFSNASRGFKREIQVSEDNFEAFSGISDLSVSADGIKCEAAAGESAEKGTYSFSKSGNVYSIIWNYPVNASSHVFSVRYVMTGAVKLYNGRAYFYGSVVNKSDNVLCKDVTLKINAPENCFPEDFEILASGSLAGEKAQGAITFKSQNSIGEIKVGISVPGNLFDESGLTVIVDDYGTVKAVSGTGGALIAAVIVLCTVYGVHYKSIFIKRWERKCRKTAYKESSYKSQAAVLNEKGPGEILKSVLRKPESEADYFILTALDLVKRGYITADSKGFYGSYNSETDEVKRPLGKAERQTIKFFRSGEFEKIFEEPLNFYFFIKKFNKSIKFPGVFDEIKKSKRALIKKSFEIKLSAKRFEYIAPGEISDDFFTGSRYNSYDLLISVINESRIKSKGEALPESEKEYKCDLFMFRRVYEKGRKAYIKSKEEKSISKGKRENDE